MDTINNDNTLYIDIKNEIIKCILNNPKLNIDSIPDELEEEIYNILLNNLLEITNKNNICKTSLYFFKYLLNFIINLICYKNKYLKKN